MGVNSIKLCLLAVAALVLACAADVPKPNERQLSFMDQEMTQFMHFGIPTFWDPPTAYLYGDNPTYHDCKTTTIDHGNQTGSFYPCLDPAIFLPHNLSCENWMQHSAAMGMREICLTAHHEGGFALWPSNFTPYSVAASSWRGGKGDVLREFADAANRWGIKICYYLNVQNDGYLAINAKLKPAEFIEREVGMVREVLTEYGPVNRFWFDGTKHVPRGTNISELWERVYETIREVSPDTMISPYRGDVCAAKDGRSVYVNNGPPPNSTDIASCGDYSIHGKYFHPTEEHGVTIQMGPDGNTDTAPTYWFWHPWACAKNISGCPWVGHGNASRLFDSYLFTVGRGAVLNMNIPPDRSGQMNASVARVMIDVGKAINQTFHVSIAQVNDVTAPCGPGIATIVIPEGATVDYVMSMEDLRQGQRIANYSIEYMPRGGSVWEPFVYPSQVPILGLQPESENVQDRPDGHDPRDSFIGRKRIDVPNATDTSNVAQLRLSCLYALEEPVYVRQFSAHKRNVPWKQ